MLYRQKLFDKPPFTVWHDTNIAGKTLQNRAILQRTHQRLLTIIRVFVPDIEIEFISVPKAKRLSIISKKSQKARAGLSLRPCSSKHIFNRNDKSEHITHLDNVVRIIIVCHNATLWSVSRSASRMPKQSLPRLPRNMNP